MNCRPFYEAIIGTKKENINKKNMLAKHMSIDQENAKQCTWHKKTSVITILFTHLAIHPICDATVPRNTIAKVLQKIK